jgi:short-subunit dehydrogenase
MYAKVLREEIRGNNIKVINVYPGAVKTDIRDPEELKQYGNKMLNPDAIGSLIYSACANAMI